MRLLLLILLAGTVSAVPLYFAVSPDSHFVVLDRAGDTLWKSPDVVIADSSWVWADVTDSLTAGFVRADSFIGPLVGNATTADSSTGGATRATTAAKLQGKDTTWVKAQAGGDSSWVFAEADSFDATALAYTRLRPVAPDSTVSIRADGVAARPVGLFYEIDLSYPFGTNAPSPWVSLARNSGTLGDIAGDATHPGVIQFLSSTTANSGYYYRTQSACFLLAGAEQADFVFRPETLIGTTIRLGFRDNNSITDPVDGVWLDITDTIALGITRNANTADTTVTSYPSVARGGATWYWGNVTLNSDATLATFTLYNGATGAVLWTDTLSAQIPTGAGRETGHGIIATNSGTTAYPLVDIDYMNVKIARRLSAGSPR